MTAWRARVRRLVAAWAGERVLPVGGVARDRRLLEQVLGGSSDPGRVLVVGAGLPVRQALPARYVDVAGTSPHAAEVTVCSSARTPHSLPAARYDTVVVTSTGEDWEGRVTAVGGSCRPGALVLVLERDGWRPEGPELTALGRLGEVRVAGARGRHRLWSVAVPA